MKISLNAKEKIGLILLVYLFIWVYIPCNTYSYFAKRSYTPAPVAEEEKQIVGYIKGEVLVQFEEDHDPQVVLKEINLEAKSIERLNSIKPTVDKFRSNHNLQKDENGLYFLLGKQYEDIEDIPDTDIFKEAYKHMGLRERGLYRIYKIYLPEGVSVKEAVDALNSSAKVEQAEPNYIIQAF